MTDLVPTFSGEVMLASWKETHTGGAVVSFFLPNPADLDVFRGMTVRKGGTAGQRLACVLVEIGEDEGPVQSPGPTVGRHIESAEASKKEVKPWGKEASELYKCGFFYAQKVLEAIGTDAEFLDWIRAQPCAVTGERDYHKDEATGTVTERCDPAHVRTVANGAGTAIKPPYCAIPLVHQLHDIETKHGKAALYLSANVGYEAMPQNVLERAASEWMDKQRNEYVVAWASKTLAAHFKQLSMGFVPPTDMRLWAKEHSVEHYLPAAYK